MVPLLTFERGWLGVGGFALLLLAESVWPFRPRVESRWRRYAINVFILGSNALFLSVLFGGLIVAAYRTFEWHHIGVLHRLGIGSWWNVLLTVVVLDGVTYLWHRAYHGLPALWRMHRVHHSDRDLDVTSSGRFHLAEMALSAIFRLGVIALLGAGVASVVVFEIVFGLLNQLEHANLRIPEPLETALRWVFVTPDMHRLHHSQRKEHTNSNYSTIFSWWDRLGGTYRFGDDQRALTIGLPEYQRPEDVTFGKVLAMPFGPPCVAARRPVGRGVAKALLFVVIVGGATWGLKAVGFDVTRLSPERVRSFVLSFGAWAPLVYLLVYAQPVVPLPTSIMTGLAGVAFGKGWGMLAALTGATCRACTEFLVARLLGREAVARLLKGHVAALDQKLGEQSFKAVLLIRLIPNVPFDLQNYGLGFSQVRFGPYMLATLLGMIPWTFVFVYLGESLTDPQQIWKLGVGILLVVGLMLAQRLWQARRGGSVAPNAL